MIIFDTETSGLPSFKKETPLHEQPKIIEFAAINVSDITTNVYNQSAYDELAAVLLSREAVSDLTSRLTGVFRAKGATITQVDTSESNIFIGDVL